MPVCRAAFCQGIQTFTFSNTRIARPIAKEIAAIPRLKAAISKKPPPDPVMPGFFFCNPQEHVAVAGFRRDRGDLRMDMVFSGLVFLESRGSFYLLHIGVWFRHQ